MAEHNELGKLGEQLARDFLIAKGYQILEQNWSCGHKEIDIIAMDGNELVIVEVKTRRRLRLRGWIRAEARCRRSLRKRHPLRGSWR